MGINGIQTFTGNMRRPSMSGAASDDTTSASGPSSGDTAGSEERVVPSHSPHEDHSTTTPDAGPSAADAQQSSSPAAVGNEPIARDVIHGSIGETTTHTHGEDDVANTAAEVARHDENSGAGSAVAAEGGGDGDSAAAANTVTRPKIGKKNK